MKTECDYCHHPVTPSPDPMYFKGTRKTVRRQRFEPDVEKPIVEYVSVADVIEKVYCSASCSLADTVVGAHLK